MLLTGDKARRVSAQAMRAGGGGTCPDPWHTFRSGDLMTQLLILYHSRTGGSAQMARAAAEAAQAECEVCLLPVAEAGTDQMLRADGYIFVGPENLAALSGEMKAFFDLSYYPLLGRLEGRPYAHMICAGSDGYGAARQLERIVTGWRLKEVQPPLVICTRSQTEAEILAPKQITPEDLALCREMGQTLAAGLSLGLF